MRVRMGDTLQKRGAGGNEGEQGEKSRGSPEKDAQLVDPGPADFPSKRAITLF